MNDEELYPEDRTILAALEALGSGTDTSGQIPRTGADETSDTLARLYLETLGLLPYALEPIAPRPEVEEALLAAIRGEASQESSDPALERAVPAPEPPVTGSRPRLIAMPPPGSRSAVRRRRWPAALAATLIAGLLGLSGWLFIQVQEGEGTIADLQAEIAVWKDRAQAATQEANKAQLDNLDLKQKFSLVTSPAVEVHTMRPDEKGPLQPEAHGVLFVAADHRHWYLCLRNLQPAEGQKAYVLWFINDQGPVASGAFNARSGGPVEMSSQQMPAGTVDVRVTLEDSAHVSQPAGQLVLKGTSIYQL